MEEKQSRQQLQSKQNDVHFLLETTSPTGGLQKEDQLQPTLSGPQWQTFLAKSKHD
jgi:hypothetical protein